MAFPDTLLAAASTWFSNVLVGAAAIQANITDNLNTLATRVTSIGQGILGEVTSAGTVTFSTTNAFAGLATKTFVLTTQRRVRIAVQADFTAATATNARYQIQAGYNSGSSAVIGSFVGVGQPSAVIITTAQTGSDGSLGTVLLAAGTYTAYASVKRANNGAATDTATSFYLLVDDIGSV